MNFTDLPTITCIFACTIFVVGVIAATTALADCKIIKYSFYVGVVFVAFLGGYILYLS